jgi:alpha-L-rhamnosidase
MGVVPADQRQAVTEHLVGAITANGFHLTVGEIALPSVFRVLSGAGRDDVVYQVATQTGNPSYGYQVVHGATSLTENWDGPTSGDSQNHFMLGAIDEWFTSGLAGIKAAPGAIGYARLVIKPAVVGDLTRVDGSYRTPYGDVVSGWTRNGQALDLEVTIPVNTTATVHVPGSATSPGLTPSGTENGYTLFTVGSGHYSFTSTL